MTVLYLSFNVFSTIVLIEDTIMSPIRTMTAIFRGHQNHAKVQPFALQRHDLPLRRQALNRLS